ncbi:MAG: TRAP transporter small permease [Planctomycetota bacterium]|jgi:TRAP-type C4-dicarboxylate transport system permease small subunit|nr:TRAP transporter small permease [Planctomycetota bacterium]
MRILRLIDENFERVVGGVCLGIVVALIFIGVTIRILFNSGLPWQEELSRVLFVFVIYVGASHGARRNEHLRVTLLQNLLPEAWRRRLDAVNDLAWIAFNILVVWYAAKSLFGPMSSFVAYSAYLSLDLRIPFAIVPVLTLLQTCRLIVNFWRRSIGENDKKGIPCS